MAVEWNTQCYNPKKGKFNFHATQIKIKTNRLAAVTVLTKQKYYCFIVRKECEKMNHLFHWSMRVFGALTDLETDK